MRFLLTLMAIALFAVSIGCDKKPEATPAATKPAAEKPAAESTDSAAATPDTEGTQTVSLKLPGMT